MEDKIQFTAKIRTQGDSKVFSVPPELIKYLELIDGDEITIIPDTGKHGKFSAFWKK